MSLTMLKNKNANKRNIVNMAKEYSQGIIFFSCSFLKALIKIIDVTSTAIPPSKENNAPTISALRTVNK